MELIPTEELKQTTSLSLENWIRNNLQEIEEMQDYSIATETVRCLIDQHKEMFMTIEKDFKTKVVELIDKYKDKIKSAENLKYKGTGQFSDVPTQSDKERLDVRIYERITFVQDLKGLLNDC